MCIERCRSDLTVVVGCARERRLIIITLAHRAEDDVPPVSTAGAEEERATAGADGYANDKSLGELQDQLSTIEGALARLKERGNSGVGAGMSPRGVPRVRSHFTTTAPSR